MLNDFSIRRDIYYACDYDTGILKEGRPFTIPAKKYFAIGDNIPNSKDSRAWNVRVITLKNGEIIKCDAEPNPASLYQDDGSIVRIIRDRKSNRGGDIWGRSFTDDSNLGSIKKDDILLNEIKPYPFISQDEIFGRGLFVYWPIKRVKLIR